eukprot:m.1240322 g.1240322  ORF g.1240322 m.1240322 type:complete len:58 (+) comp24673_c1_seq64:293-466(+)
MDYIEISMQKNFAPSMSKKVVEHGKVAWQNFISMHVQMNLHQHACLYANTYELHQMC